MSDFRSKWYAVPPDNASKGVPSAKNWQIFDETGGIVLQADRDVVEHVVHVHNSAMGVSLSQLEIGRHVFQRSAQ